MKPYTSMGQAKKSMTVHLLILTFIVVLLTFAGRIMRGNHFTMSLILSYDKDLILTDDDIRILWENDSIPVTDYHVYDVSESSIRAKAVTIGLNPDKEGTYKMFIMDNRGKELTKDEIYVDRFLTTYSIKTGNFTGDEAMIFAWILFYIGLVILMPLFYKKLKGPLANSYEAILTCGISVFSLVALIFEIPVYIRHIMTPAFYPTWQWFNDVASGGKYFTIITAPVLFIFCILLIISNINLLRHERPRFANVLGLLLGLIMISGVTVYLLIYYHSGTLLADSHRMLFQMIFNIIGIIITYAECILFASMICGLRAATHIPVPDMDYILILGCGFRKDGTLPPLLRGRVDRAMEFWKKQKEKTGKEAIIIPSGGQGKNETMAEAQAMYQYMIGTDFPEEAIIKEDQSANTYQNMEFSKKLIESRTSDKNDVKVAFSTTNYHVFRSGVWAGLAGLNAEGMGSKTKWWFWPNAFIRECVGLLRNRIVPVIFGMAFLIVVFGMMSWLSYL